MSSNTYELTYFPVKGRANMIRLLMEDQGVKYTFKAVPLEAWLELKPKTQFGALPMLRVSSSSGETQLAQSHAILRYLARELNLVGANNLEHAQVDMWIDQAADIRNKFTTMLYNNYENGLKPFVESIPVELAPFEKQLASQKVKGHLLLGKLTVADYKLFDLLLVLVALSSKCLDATPAVKAFFDSFGTRERVAAFLNRDDIKSMRFTGSPHL